MNGAVQEPRHFRQLRRILGETRSLERIRQQYELEKRLAAKLMTASAQQRGALYCEVYDDLMRQVTDGCYHRLRKDPARQAQQQKMLAGDAAWASQTSPVGKGAKNIVLHLFPSPLLNQFIQGCKRSGLHLAGVVPASALLQHQLTQLPLAKNEFGLLAAETGGSTTLVIGRNDGQILLARTVSDTWNDACERLGVNLNRTVLFANQQYSVALKGLWLFGEGADEQCDTLQRQLQLPVQVSPMAYEPFYWAIEAPKLAGELVPNLISPKLQKAPQRRVFAKVVATATALVVTGSLAASAYFCSLARREAEDAKVLSTEVARLQVRETQLEQLDSEMCRKQQAMKLIAADRLPPTPAWLLAYLGEAVPSDLVVTNLHIKRERDCWRVKLAGTPQQGAKEPEPPPVSVLVAQLEARLSGSPFYLKITEPSDPSAKEKPAAVPPQAGSPGWLSRLPSAVSGKPVAPKVTPIDHFAIEGVMR